MAEPTAQNALGALAAQGLTAYDLAVLSHGLLPNGRDYVFVLQDAQLGTWELALTHLAAFRYETRVRDEVWTASWSDVFADYDAWEAAGEPDGYVFGINWSLAYPGFSIPGDGGADDWSARLGRPMRVVEVETNQFWASLIYSEARLRRLSEDTSLASRVITPIPSR